jgi:hypothetical protein
MKYLGRKSAFKDAELDAKICLFKSIFIFPTVLERFRAGRPHGTFGFLRYTAFEKRRFVCQKNLI